MSRHNPRVSIGLPVFNGEPFIREALDSVLAQSYENYEVIISDNASTDGTAAICRDYVARDPRVRYFHNDTNLGAAWNYNHVVELSSGEYFKWLAVDDAMEPECIERCVQLLDEDPSLVLAYPRARVIDQIFSNTIIWEGTLRYERVNLRFPRASDRFREMFRHVLSNVEFIFGLIRGTVLRTALPLGAHIGADECLLVKLAIRGKFGEVPEYLLLLRWHPNSYGCLLGQIVRDGGREGIQQAEWYRPGNPGRVLLPYWRRLAEHSLSVIRSDTSPWEKMRMLVFLGHVANWHRPNLRIELRDAIGHFLDGTTAIVQRLCSNSRATPSFRDQESGRAGSPMNQGVG